MNELVRDSFIAASPATLGQILYRFDRAALEGFIDVAINLLDQADGDSDWEEDDPNAIDGDEDDLSWTEWHTRGQHALAPGTFDRLGAWCYEDAEDDDAAEDDDPGEAYDGCEQEEAGFPSYGIDQRRAVSPVIAAMSLAIANG